jgi:adenylate cyclase
VSFPFVIRHARRHLGFLAGLVVTAVAVGVVYRYSFDQLEERTLSYCLRSRLHAIGLALSGWAVLLSLAAPQLRLRGMLRRLPQTAELAIKALAMTTVLTIAAVGLQLALYPTQFFSQDWLVHHLPSIVAISFSVSLATGAIFEFRRLIGDASSAASCLELIIGRDASTVS